MNWDSRIRGMENLMRTVNMEIWSDYWSNMKKDNEKIRFIVFFIDTPPGRQMTRKRGIIAPLII